MNPSFDWDLRKDVENERKHGFADAQLAFLDPTRVIAKDLAHSSEESRFYCFGEVAARILTVRFTFRDGVIGIMGVGFWRRGRKIYDSQNKVS